MKIDGWKYYNHAAIPTTAPHTKVNLEPIENNTIWKKLDGGGTACQPDGHQTGIVVMKRNGGTA